MRPKYAIAAAKPSSLPGELDPLEIGIHAFEAVPQGKRGRGNKGDGLKAYAGKVGKSTAYITEVKQGGEVYKNIRSSESFIGKAKHLSAIHKLNRKCWQEACEWLASASESVEKVKERVELAKEETVPYRQVALFLKKTTTEFADLTFTRR